LDNSNSVESAALFILTLYKISMKNYSISFWRSNPKSKKILLKWLLLQIEDESISKDKRQALLHKLNAEYFNFKFEYPKPIHLIDTEKSVT